MMLTFVLLSALCLQFGIAKSSVPLRPRGVPISRASLYPARESFTCLDGLLTIPYIQVNDDYCDCDDGSDEPGTSACSNGIFYCNNAGYRLTTIPTSWVNDGICDCCDTSDEYNSTATCINTCHELGREALIEAEKRAELSKRGNQLRNEMIQKGNLFKNQQQQRLKDLEKSKVEAEQIKEERMSLKIKAELLETTALEQYQEANNVETEPEISVSEANAVFNLLDTNKNSLIEVAELQVHLSLDKDNDGKVSEEEAKFFLNEENQLNLEDFLKTCWPRVKPFFMKESGLFKPPHEDDVEEDIQLETDSTDENTEMNEDHEIEETGEVIEEQQKPAYDEETQRLIDLASEARNNYDNAERQVRDLEREIANLEESLKKDYGLKEEFALLSGECFEYEDREYIYKICPFDKVTQKSKSSGSETRLGVWSDWSGPEENKYSAMLYNQGASCWNGPQRSTAVHITCGLETKLVSVSEPNRCEYKFFLETPAVCDQLEYQNINENHDEL